MRSRGLAAFIVTGWLPLQPLAAQWPVSVRVGWLSLEFLVRGDTTRGLQLFATNAVATLRGPVPGITQASLDPAATVEWTQTVLPLIDSIERLIRLQGRGVIGPPLPFLDAQGELEIGYDPALPYSGDFIVIWDDSAGKNIWSAAATTERIQALLDALAAVARRSALRRSPPRPDSTTPPVMFQPPRVQSRPMLRYPPIELAEHREGRVWVDFVVDTLGKPDLASVDVLFSDGDHFTAEVLRVLGYASFQPARVGGRAVSTRVRMPFTFTLRH
jgi:TonB family protein